MIGLGGNLAVGDAHGLREMMEAQFKAMKALNVANFANISLKVYHAAASDGHQVAIHHYRKESDTAEDTLKPAVLHFHGGGMILGSVDLLENGVKAYVATTGLDIFSVDYRLAPEYPHPVPFEDCYTSLLWLNNHAADLSIDPRRIAVMGQSAGGGLAASVALAARERKLYPPLAKQILIYPMLDDRNVEPNPLLEPHLTWSTADNRTGWGALLGHNMAGDNVSAYAAASRAESLAGLPSTYCDVGMYDLFRDEDMVYVMRLAQAGVETEFHVYPGAPHAFEFLADTWQAKLAEVNRIRALQSF
ncbi:carboxylesterase NlhH [Penicillium pulvis]|uniref:carboxylesterase NlhH n=1 Tax=Penicillium pulvis TaxID=1562058 RepID=UPI0025469EDD|nr:carboxylesterase NlhH [Penicillium pulvis]KAJ5809986.1 carboxylesterase NlhH [Penicillium pulvis]